MSLQEQHQAFKFSGGIETKMDPKAVPSARLLVLENGVFSRAISIKKRNGYRAWLKAIDGTTFEISDALHMATRDDEVLLFTDNRCYSRNESGDHWSDAGALIAPTGSDRPAVHTGTAQTMPDHASAGGITVFAWEDSLGGVWWSVEDAATGAVRRAPAQVDPLAQRPRCIVVGGAIHLYYAVPARGQIGAIVVNPATPNASPAAGVLVDDLDPANPVYDACPTTRAGTPGLIAWNERATTNLRVAYVTPGGVLGSPASGHPSAARLVLGLEPTSPIACVYASSGDVHVAYTASGLGVVARLDGGTVSTPIGWVYTSPVSVYGSAVAVVRAALAIAGDTLWAAFEETDAAPSKHYCVVNTVTTGNIVGVEHTIRSVGLASRAFQAGNAADTFAVFVHDTTYFNVYLTLRLSDFAPAGRHLAAAAGGLPTRSHLSSAHVADDVVNVTLPYKVRVASANNDHFTESALRQIALDFDDVNAHQTAQLGRGLTLAGACPQHYDGRLWAEQGFHVGPELVIPVKGAGGSLTPSVTYEYVVWYEWTDNQGEVHRGPTSTNIVVAMGGADTQVTLTLPTLRVTRKSNVRICVARSLPGDASQLFRVSSLDPTVTGANGYIASNTTTDSVTFIDRMSDANLRLQETVYTTGGILSNDPTSLGSHVAVGKNRLFFTDSGEGNVVRYSQRIAPGFGPEIAPENALDVDPAGGDITAIFVRDSVVYVFKKSAIYGFNGDGPLETGNTATSAFSAPERIPGDVGCTDPRSIVLVPDGLMFKSEKGIYLLTLSNQVQYVGSPVEGFNGQDVSRALAMPGRTQVLFLTSAGQSLLYDHLFGQWSTFTNHEGLDAVVAGGVYHYLRDDSAVYKETPGEYLDGTRRITLRLETAWLHLYEHLQGFQRFWKMLILGTRISPHQFGVQYRTDYGGGWSDPEWLDATGETSGAGWLSGSNVNPVGEDPITGSSYGDGAYGDGPYGGTDDDLYQWRLGIHENGQSIQFRFEDFEKAGLAGASFELTEMTIIGGVKKLDNRPFTGARST